jgi:hypothetical protein
MIVGVMTQPLRVKYAVAHLSDRPVSARLITVQAAKVSQSELGDSIELVHVDAPSMTSVTNRLVRGSATRRVLGWARSGSQVGRRLERFIRRTLWRVRQAAPPSTPDAYTPAPAVVAAVRSTLENHDVTEIICFDVFDLVTVEHALANHSDPPPVRVR